MWAYSTGEQLKDQISLRHLGRSRSRSSEVAIDITNGNLYLLNQNECLKNIILPAIDLERAGPVGSDVWNEWANACFAASSLGLADRISAERNKEDDGD